ncbi:MAG: hypothetical protein ACRDT7_19150, partial [Microbacterium sp.]
MTRKLLLVALVTSVVALTPMEAARGGPMMTELGSLGGSFGIARAINDDGQVVGISTNASGEQLAFLWDDGEMVDLGLPGTASDARAINRAGQVAGIYTPAGANRAFLWTEGTWIDLGTLGGDLSIAYGLNDKGRVVG